MEIKIRIDGHEETFYSAEDAMNALRKEDGEDMVRKARLDRIHKEILRRANIYAYDVEIDKLPSGEYKNKAIKSEETKATKINGAIKTIISARMGIKSNAQEWKYALAHDEEGMVLKYLDEILPMDGAKEKIGEVKHIKSEISKLKTNIKDIR